MNTITLKDKTFEKYITSEELENIVTRMSDEINNDVDGMNPLFLICLNGAFMFAADLLKKIKTECQISFIKLTSYEGTESTGTAKELIGLNENIEGRIIVIVEDIIETGLTMKTIVSKLNMFKPQGIKIATLMYKPQKKETDISPDYIGKTIGNEFIVGYGLDYNGMGRNLKDIYKVKE